MRVGLRVGRGVGAFLFFFSAGLGFGGDSVFFVASCGARAVLSTLVSAVAVAVRGLLLFVVGFLVGVRAAGLGRVVVRLCSGGARVRGRRARTACRRRRSWRWGERRHGVIKLDGWRAPPPASGCVW